jgi:nitroreductase
MDVFEAIRNRRSIRHYKSDPIDDKTIQTVLEAAHWAPSWGNNQCWRFIVIRDKKIKSDIAGLLTKEKVDEAWVENAASRCIRQAPVLVVICAEKGLAGYGADGLPTTDKSDSWFMFDIALCMENLALAAHALGLGTVIIGGFDAEKVGKILNVPEGFAVVTMTPLGLPEQPGQVSPRRKLSDVLYMEKYGK